MKIKEYGGKEKYSSKAAKMKHEKMEGKKVEKMEKKGVFPKQKRNRLLSLCPGSKRLGSFFA